MFKDYPDILTVSQVAEALGVDPSTLSMKVNNKRPFTIAEVEDVSKLLKLSVKDRNTIFFWVGYADKQDGKSIRKSRNEENRVHTSYGGKKVRNFSTRIIEENRKR